MVLACSRIGDAIAISAFVFKTELNVFEILQPNKHFFNSKNKKIRGDITDISAETKTLIVMTLLPKACVLACKLNAPKPDRSKTMPLQRYSCQNIAQMEILASIHHLTTDDPFGLRPETG